MNLKFLSTLLLVSLFQYSSESQADISMISDPALKQCVQQTMQKQDISQLESLQKLKCHNKGITSIDGLEIFTNLTSLSLFGNKLTEADVSVFVGLAFLNLAKNKLQELNIEGLDRLETLHLFKNELATVNFQGVVALKKVRLMQNVLTTLDITPLISLEQAYLWDNQLEDLQINGLSKLSFLDVKQNPMPDELYDFYDKQEGITISHDGNADDWQ